ncbi:hypothetical protein FDB88_11870 [Clostridium sporogenes]|uniref:hypothetical protein n=1 Tax=Clostridium sporogenes TaxID=1509 RepID=UPI0013D7CD39|nr:hypothetical protein [Clostridium sporogenes]NFM17884.1 hypothetical protein [Clostridium sporogenes]
MKFINRSFPNIFPDGCPPEDSKHIRLKVYRLSEKDSITKDDFKSFKEKGIDKRDPKNPFIEYGLSVNTNYNELRRCWRGNPGLKRRFKKICSGITYECTGLVKATPSNYQKSHHTWWVYKEVDPSNFFKIGGGESSNDRE